MGPRGFYHIGDRAHRLHIDNVFYVPMWFTNPGSKTATISIIAYLGNMNRFILLSLLLISFLLSCGDRAGEATSETKAFVGATVFDGTGSAPMSDGVVLVRDGRIVSAGTASQVEVPDNAEVIDMKGKWIIPGLINAHGHVGDVRGLEPGHYSEENIQDQLSLYARYGITTVVSLGDDRAAAESFRAVNDTAATREWARLYIAGDVVSGDTPAEAVSMVDRNVEMGVDFLKIRVDDNLGTSTKMTEPVYKAVIDAAHDHGLKLAAHMYYLEDAKDLVMAGADFIAHSVRDVEVDTAFVRLMKEHRICYCPTLTRDLSTFVYEDRPDFFDDPFFLREVDSAIFAPLLDPGRQEQVKQSRSAQAYKQALGVAMKNLKTLSDSGVTIAFGTDSGVSGRFQGYFEHLEMELMADAGMRPEDILLSATRDAAACLGLEDVGTLENGKHADFVVLDEDPFVDITHTRSINAVCIGGAMIER